MDDMLTAHVAGFRSVENKASTDFGYFPRGIVKEYEQTDIKYP